MGVGQESYYLSKVATGLNDYYSGDGEVEGVWAGRGAQRLGLGGTVDPDALKALLAGRHPSEEARLSGRAGMAHTPGWDLTFSAPKSVSILYALGGIDAARHVVEAHDTAVAEAIGWLEAHATVSRRRIGGEVTTVAGEGLVIAGFRHRTSRLGDPQLHTHALVSNVVERNDGTWGALHSRPLYCHARTAGFLYQAVLRAQLTERLGVEWNTVENGVAEITGTSAELKALFSKRRAQIEAAMAQVGEHGSARAAQVAAYRTRPAKAGPAVEGENLYARWETEARAAGVDVDAVLAVTGRGRSVSVDDIDLDGIIDRLVDPDGGLCSSESNFDRAAVARTWCARLPTGTHVDHAVVEALIDQAVGDGRIVEIDPGGSGPMVVAADGSARRVGVGERRWTTAELLETEARMLNMTQAGRACGVAVIDEALVNGALEARPELGEDQEAMVRHVARSGNAVDVVVGRAGSGKTYALAAAVELWRTAGYEPVGVALAARAAAELQSGAGLRVSTIAQMLVDADRCDGPVLDERSVLVVDEAGMVDTRRLATLLDMARAAGAKVVLVGDHHQLPAVETGGSFAALVGRLDPVELVTNHRQVQAWEADALARLRTGAGGHAGIEEVLGDYDGHGRVKVGENPAEVRAAMALDWYRAQRNGERAVMVALRRDDVAELNVRARAMLLADGTLDDTDAVTVGERSFSVGDRVVCGRNDRRLRVHNALAGTITAIQPGTGTVGPIVWFADDAGNDYAVPVAYVEAGHLDHGYATTIHKAQGATVDRCLVLGDDRLYRQAGYAALSRGRLANDLYLIGVDDRDTYPELELDRHGAVVEDTPRERIVRALHRDGGKELALDIAARHGTSTDGGESLAELWATWDQTVTQLGEAPTDHRDALDEMAEQHSTLSRVIEGAEQRQAGVHAAGAWWRRWMHTVAGPDRHDPRRVDTQVEALHDRRRELAGRLDELAVAQHQRELWLAEHAEQLEALEGLAEQIEWRTTQAGRAAELDRPADVVDHLGEPPVGDRSAWRAAAGAIESYNARFAHIDTDEVDAHRDHARHLAHVTQLVAGADRAVIEVEVPGPSLTP